MKIERGDEAKFLAWSNIRELKRLAENGVALQGGDLIAALQIAEHASTPRSWGPDHSDFDARVAESIERLIQNGSLRGGVCR